jgi:hypothetical protein
MPKHRRGFLTQRDGKRASQKSQIFGWRTIKIAFIFLGCWENGMWGVYNKLHKTQRQPSAFKPYGCWGRASRSAPAYPGEANRKCYQAIQKVQFVMHTTVSC